MRFQVFLSWFILPFFFYWRELGKEWENEYKGERGERKNYLNNQIKSYNLRGYCSNFVYSQYHRFTNVDSFWTKICKIDRCFYFTPIGVIALKVNPIMLYLPVMGFWKRLLEMVKVPNPYYVYLLFVVKKKRINFISNPIINKWIWFTSCFELNYTLRSFKWKPTLFFLIVKLTSFFIT